MGELVKRERRLRLAASCCLARSGEEESVARELAAEITWGNAADQGARGLRRGWFIGHFMPPAAGPAATEVVEVKWGRHPAGETKALEGVNQTATTVSLLVSGRFRLDFPSHGRSVALERPGDYAIWSAGVSHRWLALEDAVVITVRWPSRPADQIGQAAGPWSRSRAG
jgi:hypothetical protein